ncbi:MAG: beta-phosphoglucomutase [Defluviitaleaceae bacterium]|nr:beta-phosphoglucomutase [Defluviitaleaceae bacterium]
MKHIKGIIFDLDGVLVHTDELHYQAWKQIADKAGIPFDREVNHRLRGVSRMESLAIILENDDKNRTDEEKQAMADEKNKLYRNLLKSLTPLSVEPDIRKSLHALREKGIKLAIGSSSKNARTILQNIGLSTMFDAVSDGNNITHSKPHPEVFLLAAQYMGLTPEECTVVEDARAGVDAAVDGGFTCFAMGDAADYGRATHRIENVKDILDYFD